MEKKKIPSSRWRNNPLTVFKRRASFVPSRAKSLSVCANDFQNIPLCVFLIHGNHTQICRCAHTYIQPHTQPCGYKVTPSIDKSPSCDSLLTAQTNIKLVCGGGRTKDHQAALFLTLLFNHGQIAYDSTSSCFVFIFPHLIKRVKSYFCKYFTSPHTAQIHADSAYAHST